MTAHTPAYGIEYLVEGEPIRSTRLVLENNAKTIEAALIAGGIAPPLAPDLAAAVARIGTLETPPMFRARRVAAQSIPTGAFTAITWDTFDIDTHNMKTSGTASITIKCQRAGIYGVRFGVDVGPSAGRVALQVMKALAATPTVFAVANIGRTQSSTTTNANNGVDCEGLLTLAVNDLVRFDVYQDQGTAQNTQSQAYSPTLCELEWKRP